MSYEYSCTKETMDETIRKEQMEDASSKSSGAAELGLDNVGGVFVVLIGGMVMAAFMAVCEFMWNARELATDENVSCYLRN